MVLEKLQNKLVVICISIETFIKSVDFKALIGGYRKNKNGKN